MEGITLGDANPMWRPSEAAYTPSVENPDITADTWTITAAGALSAVENSIHHNVQLCVVRTPDNGREWHVNNFNTQGIQGCLPRVFYPLVADNEFYTRYHFLF
jgi:hypothetical protein